MQQAVSLPEDVTRRLREYAKDRSISQTAIATQAITAWLDKQDPVVKSDRNLITVSMEVRQWQLLATELRLAVDAADADNEQWERMYNIVMKRLEEAGWV
jgi:hypothetical protein